VASVKVRYCGGRDAVPLHERLGEVLRTLELRGSLRRAEDPQAGRAEDVDDAGRQRRLGSDDGERHAFVAREPGQRLVARYGTLRRRLSRAVPPLPGAT
jgi:hypothetical protein